MPQEPGNPRCSGDWRGNQSGEKAGFSTLLGYDREFSYQTHSWVSSLSLFFFKRKFRQLKKETKTFHPFVSLSSHFRQSTHNARSVFCIMSLVFLGGWLHVWDNMLLFLWLTYFPSHNVLKVYLCCHKWISFHCIHSVQLLSRVRLFAISGLQQRQDSTVWLSNVPLCIYITFVYPLSCQWTFILLPYLGYCNRRGEHRGAYIFSS